MKNNVKKRDKSLDFLRILSMLLVIIIHLSNYYCRRYSDISTSSYLGATIYNAISRVSVPIFFMISGSLILGQNYEKEKYIKKIKRFVIVLISWNIIYILWNKFYMNIDITSFKDIISLIIKPVKAHLWFLYAILGLYIITPFIQNMLKNMDNNLENLFIKLWLIFSGFYYIIKIIIQSLLHINFEVIYPIPLVQATYYLGYYIVGYILYKRITPEYKKYERLSTLLLVLCSLITISATFIISLLKGKYFELLFGYRSIFIIISSLCVYSLILINKDKFEDTNIFEKLSPYSFGVYLFHVIPFNILTENINILKINSFIGVPLFSFLVFIVTLPCVYLLNKIPIIKKIL